MKKRRLQKDGDAARDVATNGAAAPTAGRNPPGDFTPWRMRQGACGPVWERETRASETVAQYDERKLAKIIADATGQTDA